METKKNTESNRPDVPILGYSALASLLVLTSLACDGNLPEITPGPLSRPTKIETHGPIQA